MGAATALLVVAIAGVNFGWQPAPNGAEGYEYIVQVEPELLDAMQRGESVPIESNIPADVAPIRKVTVVVGRGEPPRAPIQHTANFADQAGWTSDRYPPDSTSTGAASNYERYPAQGQSLVDRTGTAVAETSNAISEGVQAGMRSAQEQLSRTGNQMLNDSRSAMQQMSQQLQSTGSSLQSATGQTFDATGNQIRQAANSIGLTGSTGTAAGANGVSAPPWPASPPSTAAQQTAGAPSSSPVSAPGSWPTNPANARTAADATPLSGTGGQQSPVANWSNNGGGASPPPLLNSLPATDTNSNMRTAQSTNSAGPSLGSPATGGNREPIHSVLVDPSRQQANGSATTNDWGSGWGTSATATTPATIGRSADATRATDTTANAGLVPVQPRYPAQQDTQQAASRWSDPWAENDPWKQQPQQQGSLPQNARPTSQGQTATNNGWPTTGNNAATMAANSPPNLPVTGQSPAAFTNGGANIAAQTNVPQGTNLATMNPTVTNNAVQPNPQAAQQPWLPLLLVTLSLVGSLSANFYLVTSYLSARYKYVSLVQKTADTFRRAASTAAAA